MRKFAKNHCPRKFKNYLWNKLAKLHIACFLTSYIERQMAVEKEQITYVLETNSHESGKRH